MVAVVALVLTSDIDRALGQGATPSKVTLAPHIGIAAESEVVDGAVVFSDGDVDSILVEPDAGLLLGLELGVRLRPKLTGVLVLAFSTADAAYIEDGNLRPDAEVDTVRFQPGVMVTAVQRGKTSLAFGGGLTLARYSIDRMVWNDNAISPDATSIGLFGAGALDVALSPRVAFHTHLALEINRPSYGDLEVALAAADGEAGADVDHDTRTALVLAVGVAFGL